MMSRWTVPNVWAVLSAIFCLAAAQGPNGPAVDWIQRNENGAYRFGYATGDEGRHYHLSSASADNTVAGKYGSKDPVTGGDLQTTYTSGRRGFRARGPHIARHMDLSQNKPPFSRPNNDGQYHPELDNVFDPNEDRGYDFTSRSKDYVKEERANAVGDVEGRYSYVDDVGGRHDVSYIAGSQTGFQVTNPVPDKFVQIQSAPLFFVGKRPGPKARGFTAVQKGLDGSYRFAASGPDHKRTETSDAHGNVRGTYTYLDDKGIQHTVEYIAGPNIGYKVINNHKGTHYNPAYPYYPDVSTPLPAIDNSIPPFVSSLPSLDTTPPPSLSNPSPLPPLSNTPTSLFEENPPQQPPQTTTTSPSYSSGLPTYSPTVQPFPSFSSNPSSFPSFSPTPSSSPSYSSKPSSFPSYSSKPSSFPSYSSKPSSFPSYSSKPSSFPSFSTTQSSYPSHDPTWPYYDDYLNAKDWSKHTKIGSNTKVTIQKPYHVPPSPDYSDFGFLHHDLFPDEGLNAAESGRGVSPQYQGNHIEHGNNRTQDMQDEQDEHFFESSSTTKRPYNPRVMYRGDVRYNGVRKPPQGMTRGGQDEYFRIPTGVAVRAHVQSLDLVPPEKKYISPGDALDGFNSHSSQQRPHH